MTYDDYVTESTELLDGIVLGDTVIKTLLNTARTIREQSRKWKVLEKIDSSLSISAGDVHATANSLPTDFVQLVDDIDTDSQEISAVRLIDAGDTSNVLRYKQVPFGERLGLQDSGGKFCIDYLNDKIYFLGNIDKARTAHISYIHDSGDITTGSETWTPFPSRFHRVLLFDLVAMHELGVDYDDVNARMGNSNVATAERLFKAMTDWDNSLAMGQIGL